MKILHLSTSDIEGGAARAAYRLHQGLRKTGETSQMLVRAKFSRDRTVIAEKSLLTKLGPVSSGFPLKLYPKREKGLFSSQWFPDAISKKVKEINPDLINLHWINNGYLKIETLQKLNKPLVWILHDMWSFTGGCHYSQDCLDYTKTCGSCPQLKSQKDFDLSHWIWKRKKKAWSNLNLTLISPSQWLADCAQSSSLFKDKRIEVIPHGLDLKKYKPVSPSLARELLGLPPNKTLILFGASPGTTGDSRKGFQLLQPALKHLHQSGLQDKIELVIFGDTQPDTPPNLGFKTHYLGQFQDDISLALVYSSADVMVVPSVQEAFGQTASESLACGTPVVAFRATGLKDIITHQKDGYLANPFDINDLANGIAWVIEASQNSLEESQLNRTQKLRHNAREKAEKCFSDEFQARHYISLFNEILKAQS